MRRTLIAYIVLIFSHVLSIQNAFTQTQSDTSLKKIYIVKHGWHTGIIFNRKEAMPYLLKLNNEYIDAQFLEISWGDKDFFKALAVHTLQVLKAWYFSLDK